MVWKTKPQDGRPYYMDVELGGYVLDEERLATAVKDEDDAPPNMLFKTKPVQPIAAQKEPDPIPTPVKQDPPSMPYRGGKRPQKLHTREDWAAAFGLETQSFRNLISKKGIDIEGWQGIRNLIDLWNGRMK